MKVGFVKDICHGNESDITLKNQYQIKELTLDMRLRKYQNIRKQVVMGKYRG